MVRDQRRRPLRLQPRDVPAVYALRAAEELPDRVAVHRYGRGDARHRGAGAARVPDLDGVLSDHSGAVELPQHEVRPRVFDLEPRELPRRFRHP